jgi:hypothetical protein
LKILILFKYSFEAIAVFLPFKIYSVRKILFLFILSLFASVSAQNYTVSGVVTDKKNGETIMGAIVSVDNMPNIGVATNAYGYYSIQLPAGSHTIKARYIGYEEEKLTMTISQNTKLNISLDQKGRQVKEVVVSAKKREQNVSNVQVSKVQVDLAEIDKIPVILGERDVLKSIQLLPGIMPAQEGQSGFIVRGGNTDQNLILLDEAPVYNASHLLGFFSTFNSDALKDLTLYKGNMPAEFGGRLSSVVDIKMKEGNNKDYNFGGGIGLIATRLFAEGPLIKKEKGSFFVSGRRTYADAFLALSNDSVAKSSTLYFYDLNAKANYKFDDKNRVFLSGYFGQDKFGFSNVFGITYGNTTFTGRWNHVFNDKLFSNTSLIYNNFNYTVTLNFNDFDLYVKSILNDFSIKQDFDYFLNDKNRFKFGFLGIWHNVKPGDVSSSNDVIASKSLSRSNGLENAIYFQNEQKVSSKLSLSYGMRISSFSVAGPNSLYQFDANGTPIDTTNLGDFKFGKSYINLEPRFSGNYSFNENSAVKFAYSRNAQNLHLLSNTSASRPTDRWILTTNNVRPEISDQISGGYFFNFLDNMFEASVETYFKWMQNQIDYKTGTQLRANETVEKDLVYGNGRAYGLELFLKKKVGKFTGWISYTLSRSERQFDDIEGARWFASRYDRTHDLSIVAMYELSRKVSLSANYVLYTGNAVTFPTGKTSIGGYNPGGVFYNTFNGRNLDRFPTYNRLDVALNWDLKKSKHYEHGLNFSIYNVLGTKNAYLIDFKSDDQGQTYAEKTYLFRFVPSITYNFKFSPKSKPNEDK